MGGNGSLIKIQKTAPNLERGNTPIGTLCKILDILGIDIMNFDPGVAGSQIRVEILNIVSNLALLTTRIEIYNI